MVVVMEGKPTAHLKNVLKRYQQSARNTLNGPGRFEQTSGNTSSSSTSSSLETNSNTCSPNSLTTTPSNFSGAGTGNGSSNPGFPSASASTVKTASPLSSSSSSSNNNSNNNSSNNNSITANINISKQQLHNHLLQQNQQQQPPQQQQQSNLLHQQLQLQQSRPNSTNSSSSSSSTSTSSSPFSSDTIIKKENLSRYDGEEIAVVHHQPPPPSSFSSGFVPVVVGGVALGSPSTRRNSGGAVEVGINTWSNCDSQIRNAQVVGRSKSTGINSSSSSTSSNNNNSSSCSNLSLSSSSSIVRANIHPSHQNHTNQQPPSLQQLQNPIPNQTFLNRNCGLTVNITKSSPSLSSSSTSKHHHHHNHHHHHHRESATSPSTLVAGVGVGGAAIQSSSLLTTAKVGPVRSPSISGGGGNSHRATLTINGAGPQKNTALMRDSASSSAFSSSSVVSVSFPPGPLFSTPDRSRTEKRETLLEGQYISCFVVGGEKRLCFLQILTSVLRGFTLPQINKVCDELQIYCSRCSAEQLELLKKCEVIPLTAASCGLIKKTDAERLVNSLLHRNPPQAALAYTLLRPKDHIMVYHKCFGKAKGVVCPHLYDKPEALCIECVDCHGLFSPSRFVAHSHHRTENQVVHWGFDSANWRNYLQVFKDKNQDSSRWETILVEFKAKFDHKRKELRPSPELDDHVQIKKIRCDTSALTPATVHHNYDFPLGSTSCLPTKKRPPFHQYSNNDQTCSMTPNDVERVKKMLLQKLGPEGADVNVLLDNMVKQISSLEQICREQEKYIKEVSHNSKSDLQTKVSSMEVELQSLKKKLLHRHQHHIQSEEI